MAASQPSRGKISALKTDSGITFSSRLLGKGFHRKVEYSWTRELAADDNTAIQGTVGIVQPLPAALFADLNQLRHSARRSSLRADAVAWMATLLGSSDADTEGTVLESKPGVLVVQANSSGAISASAMGAVFCIPLHARYATPVNAPRALLGWNWARSALVTTALPPATLLLPPLGGNGSWRDGAEQTDVIWWDSPAASLMHGSPVGLATSAAVVLSCSLVLMEAGRLRSGC